MAETCAWPDCRSSEVQPHMVTRQCLTCGRHSDLKGRAVVWVMGPESRWEYASDVLPQPEQPQPEEVA